MNRTAFRALRTLIATLPTAAWADAPPQAPGLPAGSMLQAFLGLIFILGLFFLAAWLMRRLQSGRGTVASAMRVLGAVAVGSRERIVLVEIGETWLVIGIAPGQIRTLHTLPKRPLDAPAGPSGPSEKAFSDWLRQILDRKHESP